MEHILFLCTGNYYRSRFAEEYFNYYAELREIEAYASSKGLARDIDALRNPGPISANTLKKLNELNITPRRPDHLPESVTKTDLQQADRAIALCDREHRPMIRQHFPEFEHKIEYWEIEDVQVETAEQALPQLLNSLNHMLRKY